jgi:hypothetical protein
LRFPRGTRSFPTAAAGDLFRSAIKMSESMISASAGESEFYAAKRGRFSCPFG